jgi:DNA-binding Xre family transcriptional regulator
MPKVKKPEPTEFYALIQALKRILRQRGMKYRTLAKELGLSESSIKKLFIAKDCSFGRIVAICRVLEVPLEDLLQASHEAPVRQVELSAEVQAYFLKNMDCFHFYCLLGRDPRSLQKIKQENRLSERDLAGYLRKLDRIGLIQLEPSGRIRFPTDEPSVWANEGPLIEHIRARWMHSIVDSVIAKPVSEKSHYWLRQLQLRPESAKALLESLREVVLDFSKLSVREAKLYGDDVIDVRLIAAYEHGRFVRGIREADGNAEPQHDS